MLEEVSYVPYEEEKLRELLLYVAAKTERDPNAGATKLNKYLYFSDFTAVRKLGHPITGAVYRRLPHGPAPRRLPPVRAGLIKAGAARLETRTDGLGYVHHNLIPRREPRMDLFSEEEIRIVDEVIETLRGLNAAEVSALSHREAGWQLVREGETIPYELAFVLAPARAEPTPRIKAEGDRLLEQYRHRLA